MVYQLNALVLNHNNADISSREVAALNGTERQALYTLISEENFENFMIVSTCNRTEFYFDEAVENVDKVLTHLISVKSLDKTILSQFDFINDPSEVVTYLMRVTVGLESLILGDLQIFSQIKASYKESNNANLSGTYLHRLMHTVFYAHKRIVQETSFKNGTSSVAFSVATLVKKKISEFVNPKVLVIGTGEMGSNVVKNVLHLTDGTTNYDLSITNRTNGKAQCLAARNNISYLPFESLHDSINDFDIIVSAIGLETYILDSTHFTSPSWRHKYLFDLGMPRTISPELEKSLGMIVYNIDEIRIGLTGDSNKREQSIRQVNEILKGGVEDFFLWTEKLQASSAIKLLKIELEEIRKKELQKYRTMYDIPQGQLGNLEQMTTAMMQKVLNHHVIKFNLACKRGDTDVIISAINELFDIDRVKEKLI